MLALNDFSSGLGETVINRNLRPNTKHVNFLSASFALSSLIGERSLNPALTKTSSISESCILVYYLPRLWLLIFLLPYRL